MQTFVLLRALHQCGWFINSGICCSAAACTRVSISLHLTEHAAFHTAPKLDINTAHKDFIKDKCFCKSTCWIPWLYLFNMTSAWEPSIVGLIYDSAETGKMWVPLNHTQLFLSVPRAKQQSSPKHRVCGICHLSSNLHLAQPAMNMNSNI